MRMCILVVLSCLAAAPLGAQSSGDRTGVLAAVNGFHAAMTAGDAAKVMALVADDAVFIEAGGVETRAEFEKGHLPADMEFEKGVTISRGPARLAVVGDAAWVTTVSDIKGTFRKRPVDLISAELMILSRGPRGWQIRAVHWSGTRRPAQ